MSRKTLLLLLLLMLLVVIVLVWLLFVGRGERRPPVVMRDATGAETTEFQPHDSLVVDVVGLEPRTGYDVEVLDDDGTVVIANHLSTDSAGAIPATVLWYAVGIRPCWQPEFRAATVDVPGTPTATTILPYSEIVDRSVIGRDYTLRISRAAQTVLETAFHLADSVLRPTLYTADERGCPKTGFLLGEEDVWVVGRSLPADSLLRVWAVPADDDWRDGKKLEDQTGLYGYELPSVVELRGGDRSFRRLLWPRGLTSLGSYDVAAEVVDYAFGTYRVSAEATVTGVVANATQSGFVIQRRPGAAEPLEVDIAGVRESPFTFRNTFLTNENVYVGVDPTLQPSYVGQTADVYIVANKTDAQWTTDSSLTDLTGVVETITVNGICGNCWKTLAWTAPLTVGEYDVVLDFDRDGAYTAGVDLIDSLDPVGFTVAEVRVDSISFNYPGSGAVTIHDAAAGNDVAAPEYLTAGQVVRPAAWVMGGSHSVRVSFRAVPTLSAADVWALGGLGGLASSGSPVSVSFSGGAGQHDFAVNMPPAAVAKTTFTWDFKYEAGGGPAEMGSTEHVLFSVLGTPVAPQATPWVDTLEVASAAAAGETTAAGATRAIWDEFYRRAGGLYDTVSGAPRYTAGSTGSAFNLTMWLANLEAGSVGVVNCYDLGKAVVVFANALGAGAEYTYSSPFGYLNLVHPIGRGWTNNPFYDNPGANPSPVVPGDSSSADGRWGFGNHAFSRFAGQIYDGSGGQVDIDGDPDSLPVGTPWDLDGDDSWTSSFRVRVIDDTPPSNPGTPTVYTFGVY
jgi:hypothetical protein